MIRRPPRSTPLYSSAASDVYKRQADWCVLSLQRRPPSSPTPEIESHTLGRRHRQRTVTERAKSIESVVDKSRNVLHCSAAARDVVSVSRRSTTTTTTTTTQGRGLGLDVSVSRRSNVSSQSRLFTSRAQDVIFDRIVQATLTLSFSHFFLIVAKVSLTKRS